jgi:chorismate synthase
MFRVTTFGESHGPALGCVVDGCPAGIPVTAAAVDTELARRRPGGGGAATTRREPDACEILSGVFEGRTLGTPIAIIIRNSAQKSADYAGLKDLYRPGHADWCWEAKYGLRDYTGGGRSSGRETAARVAAGVVAKLFLSGEGVSIRAWTQAIAGITAPAPGEAGFDLDAAAQNPLVLPCKESAEKAAACIDALRKAEESAGGIVACRVTGLIPGVGEPVFEKLDGCIAGAMLSLGAAKGVEFGAGFAAAAGRGSTHNDAPRLAPSAACADSEPFYTNNAGGVLGGISNGMPLDFRVAFKPVPSIGQEQRTVDRDGRPRALRIGGRHDVCVCPRAVPVVEAMTALVLADLLLQNRSARLPCAAP